MRAETLPALLYIGMAREVAMTAGRLHRPPPAVSLGRGAALEQGDGETGFPHPLTRWEGLGGRSPPRNTLWSSVGVRRSRMDG